MRKCTQGRRTNRGGLQRPARQHSAEARRDGGHELLQHPRVAGAQKVRRVAAVEGAVAEDEQRELGHLRFGVAREPGQELHRVWGAQHRELGVGGEGQVHQHRQLHDQAPRTEGGGAAGSGGVVGGDDAQLLGDEVQLRTEPNRTEPNRTGTEPQRSTHAHTPNTKKHKQTVGTTNVRCPLSPSHTLAKKKEGQGNTKPQQAAPTTLP